MALQKAITSTTALAIAKANSANRRQQDQQTLALAVTPSPSDQQEPLLVSANLSVGREASSSSLPSRFIRIFAIFSCCFCFEVGIFELAPEAASSSITDSSTDDQPNSTGQGSGTHEQRTDTASVESGTKSPSTARQSSGAKSPSTERQNSGTKSPSTARQSSDIEGTELTDQFEPGVYVSSIQLHDGTRVFKGVRYCKSLFGPKQAQDWWYKNRERVMKYIHPYGTAPIQSSSVLAD